MNRIKEAHQVLRGKASSQRKISVNSMVILNDCSHLAIHSGA